MHRAENTKALNLFWGRAEKKWKKISVLVIREQKHQANNRKLKKNMQIGIGSNFSEGN